MSDARIGDLDRKAVASAAAARWAERSQAARAGQVGAADPSLANHFAQITDVGGVRIATTSDGVGTKVELAERTGRYDTLGFDLVAMVVDDLAAAGAVPLSVTNVLDVDRIDPAVVEALMSGLFAAAVEAEVSISGGETAELGPRIGGFGPGMHFNWCATAIGWFPPGVPPLTGAALQPGDALIALPSPGFRSNGLTLARRVLADRFGPDWHRETEGAEGGRSWGEALLEPSRVYSAAIVSLRAVLEEGLTGVAHITGGGIPNKLGRVLRATGLGADIDAPLPPPADMAQLGAWGEVAPADAFRVWNQGHGMILATRPGAVEAALRLLAARGHAAQVVGAVSARPGVRIRPHDQDTLHFEAQR